ncbi:hypothetical protein AZE42_10880 [Rhizopogon vesiculosus]|uniref:Uncharacterized protein n=1 Tax=Rhizopogon vesiculosus TaxID=180088 RepID=A0A1J8Q1A4_9AGAM|nr:hypothetical protein AZE42_10880 [Rhizopogon vesiculosus]
MGGLEPLSAADATQPKPFPVFLEQHGHPDQHKFTYLLRKGLICRLQEMSST